MASDLKADDLVEEDGRAKCPEPNCDWWVPAGMEYLAAEHDCDAEGGWKSQA